MAIEQNNESALANGIRLSRARAAVVSDRCLRLALTGAGWPTEGVVWFRRGALALLLAAFVVLSFEAALPQPGV